MTRSLNAAVARLDLSFVEHALAREGLSAEEIGRTIHEYRCFLALGAEGHSVAPTNRVDRAWHAHISHTALYRRHCAELTGGRFLDHDPTVVPGMPVLDEAFERTRALMAEFGVTWPPLGSVAPDHPEAAGTCYIPADEEWPPRIRDAA